MLGKKKTDQDVENEVSKRNMLKRIVEMAKRKDKSDDNVEVVEEIKEEVVEVLTPEDEKWVDDMAMRYIAKREKKASKTAGNRLITKAQKIKGLGAGVVAGAGVWVGYNFAMRKIIEMDLDNKLSTKQGIQELVYEQLASQYPTYFVNSAVDTSDVVRLAEELYGDGKQTEAQLVLDLLNGLESGVFQVGDINQFLINNNLSTVASNMTPTQAETEDALYQAYADVYGFNPKDMTDHEVIQAIIDNHMRPLGEPGDSTLDLYWMFETLPSEKQAELNKIHEDYVILLNKTNNVHNTNAKGITEADIDALIQSKQGIWASDYTGDANTSFGEKLEYVVREIEWELSTYSGAPDMQFMLSIQNSVDHGNYTKLDAYPDYMQYRVLSEKINQQTDFMSTHDVMDLFGYEGNVLAEYRQMGSDDYLFARIMEDKYDGLTCVKDNGQIDFNNITGLSGQDLADYQADLLSYNNWKQGTTTQDALEGVQDLGFLSDSYQNDYVTDATGEIVGNPIMELISGVAVVGLGAGVVLGYKKWKKHQNSKFIKTWNEEMDKRGLTEEDFIKHHYSFEEVDESNENTMVR